MSEKNFVRRLKVRRNHKFVFSEIRRMMMSINAGVFCCQTPETMKLNWAIFDGENLRLVWRYRSSSWSLDPEQKKLRGHLAVDMKYWFQAFIRKVR